MNKNLHDKFKESGEMCLTGIKNTARLDLLNLLNAAEIASFQIGDTVKLRSGGPEMTIRQINAGPNGTMVTCTWFNGQQLLENEFCAKTLKRITSAICNSSILEDNENKL